MANPSDTSHKTLAVRLRQPDHSSLAPVRASPTHLAANNSASTSFMPGPQLTTGNPQVQSSKKRGTPEELDRETKRKRIQGTRSSIAASVGAAYMNYRDRTNLIDQYVPDTSRHPANIDRYTPSYRPTAIDRHISPASYRPVDVDPLRPGARLADSRDAYFSDPRNVDNYEKRKVASSRRAADQDNLASRLYAPSIAPYNPVPDYLDRGGQAWYREYTSQWCNPEWHKQMVDQLRKKTRSIEEEHPAENKLDVAMNDNDEQMEDDAMNI